ncbi:MAG: phytanoyl-CoA dioxygenase family protein [Pseudonocardiaceae bacterium]
MPFGDGGLGLAVGSHHQGRLPRRDLPEFTDRAAPGQSASPQLATGIDPGLVNDHWHTASMEPGDLIVFRPDVVHRGLPATSDRIRIALTGVASATSDPLPHTMYTGPENRARHKRVRELAAPLGLSELELFGITADLTRAGVAIDEETVRAAARGDYARSEHTHQA